MAYNKLRALTYNVWALETAYKIVCNGKERTTDDCNTLRQYSGFGGIKEVLDIEKYMADGYRPVEQFDKMMLNLVNFIKTVAKGDSYKEDLIVQSLKNSVLTAFYTPKEVINAVGNAVNHVLGAHGVGAELLLEPSAGIGGFLPVCSNVKKVAFEKDILSAMVCAALNPDVDVYNDVFENISNTEAGHKYDVVASNIPFGDHKAYDKTWRTINDEVHTKCQEKIHTYFFVKGLEMLEDGGILAFVTSRGIADAPSNEYLRRWLVSNGNLLAAVRLPDNLFVDGSGVEVGSDLIVFQRDYYKSWQSPEEEMFCESIMKTFGDTTIGPVNRLLCLPRKSVHTDWKFDTDRFGQKMVSKYYWRKDFSVLESELTTRLSRDMERNFRRSAWIYGHDKISKRIEIELRQRDEQREKRKNEAMIKAAEKRREKQMKLRPVYDEVMAAYNELMRTERIYKMPNNVKRTELNELYDKMVLEFGTLHDNKQLIEKFPESLLALTLERKEAVGVYVKSDVFVKPVAYREISGDEVYSPAEALSICLNEHCKVDMLYIMSLTKINDEVQLYELLKGDIFYTIGDGEKFEWQHRSKCINGNVIAKRKNLERVCGGCQYDWQNEALKDTIDALKKATPTPVPYDDIDVQLGTRWIPTRHFENFLRHIFSLGRNIVDVDYIPANDSFATKWNDFGSRLETKYTDYACKTPAGHRYSGADIFDYALLDKCPEITMTIGSKWDGTEKTVKDEESMRVVGKAIDKMRRVFEDYMHSDKICNLDRREIETLYNEKFNCFYRADFDGALQTFPGLDLNGLGFSDLYSSQKDAIWMLKQNNGGVCWHQVGAGKTMIMCVTAYEMHRLGLCNKPVIIGLKANVHEIAATFRKAYPSARLLYPGREDFSAKKREELFSKIKNNDWDCIVLTHDQFCMIPMSPETETRLINDELKEIDEALKLFGYDCDRNLARIKRGLETRKSNLKIKLQKIADERAERATNSIDFHQMGIDHIFVDEYHQFKNLGFTTRHGRVAGIGNPEGSKRALTLLTAIRDIQMTKGKDMCASFFSGTVVVNALTELYVLFKYLRPSELKRQNITCFDAWASTFTKKSSDYDLTITGEIKRKERFRKYVGVSEMAQFLREITDYRTAEMIQLDIPKANVIFDSAEPTADQNEMLDRLIKFANGSGWSVLGLQEYKEPANLKESLMLVATDIARKVSLDTRMLGESQFCDDENNKSSRCARKIYDYYTRFNEHKATQFVFSDLSTYDKSRWNIYSDIRDKLVNIYGIPEREIAFIQEYDSENKRKKLFEDLNAGRVRVVFGSTQKLGTGVNAQQRAVAVHHLDIPWRPADLEQRNGRAVRKGNEVKIWGNNTVDVIIYGTERTLDAYKFNLLKNKALFIKQINNGTIATRHIDEDSMSEGDGMNFAEYVALLSGNTDLLQKARLDNKITNLEKDKALHQRTVREANEAIETAKLNIKRDSELLRRLEKDIDALSAAKGGLIVTGAKEQTTEEQGRKLFEYRKNATSSLTQCGTYKGFPIYCFLDDGQGTLQEPRVRFNVKMPSGTLRRANKEGNIGAAFETAIKYFGSLEGELAITRSTLKNSIAYNEANIESQSKVASSKWDGNEELRTLTEERDRLQERIDADLAKKNDNLVAQKPAEQLAA